MKRIILSCLMALALLSTSCANQTSSLEFEKFYPMGPACSPNEFVEAGLVGNGYLDVAWGNPVYVVGVRLLGAEGFNQPAVQVGDNVLERAGRDQPVIRQIVINYRTSRPLGVALKEHVIPFTAGVGGNPFGSIQLLSAELSQALVDTLSAANDLSDVVDVSIDVQFEGEMSVSRSKVASNTMTFPLRVFKSAPTFTCANGFRRFEVDPLTGVSCLYNGQTFTQNAPPQMPFDPATDCCPTAGAPGC